MNLLHFIPKTPSTTFAFSSVYCTIFFYESSFTFHCGYGNPEAVAPHHQLIWDMELFLDYFQETFSQDYNQIPAE